MRQLKHGDYNIVLSPGREVGQIFEEPWVRFFRKIHFEGDCWIWTGTKNTSGHGRFSYKGKLGIAARFSYEYFVEPLENGLLALHKEICGNPSCVKPSHLYAGTHKDNVRDRIEWGATAQYGALTGERHGMAKLDEAAIFAIKQMREEGLGPAEISNIFSVGPKQIYYICSGRSWRHLK